MALYLPRQNALFLLPPQTVGTEVRRTLKWLELEVERIGHPHATLAHLEKFRAEKRPFTTAFVTHPLTWYAAYWRHAKQRDPRWKNSPSTATPDELAWPLDPALGPDDFAEFIDRVSRRDGFLRDLFGQYTGLGTEQEVDVIAKSERLVEHLQQVFNRIGVAAPAQVMDRIPTRRRYRGSYTLEMQTMVAHAESGTFGSYHYRPPKVDRAALDRRKAEFPLRPSDIPGWLSDLDRDIFRLILAWQSEHEPVGDLVELGAYLGKSAVIIGEGLRGGETFRVCDLFGADAAESANLIENRNVYKSVTREEFERYYRTFRGDLPAIYQLPTSQILDHVSADSARFVHVDASHLYEHVVTDIASARVMLRPGGIVVFDDYRSTHTPGVAAAVWTAMATGGLRPIALTPKKWYGTWDDPEPLQRELLGWLRADHRFGAQIQRIAGADVLRVFMRRGGSVNYEEGPPASFEAGNA